MPFTVRFLGEPDVTGTVEIDVERATKKFLLTQGFLQDLQGVGAAGEVVDADAVTIIARAGKRSVVLTDDEEDERGGCPTDAQLSVLRSPAVELIVTRPTTLSRSKAAARLGRASLDEEGETVRCRIATAVAIVVLGVVIAIVAVVANL